MGTMGVPRDGEANRGTAGTSRPSRPARGNHIGSFDGLRALALLSIVLYHFRPSLLPGGYLGVTVFFVLGGYLLTLSLERARRLGLRGVVGIWRRRLSRMCLPVYVVILATAIACLAISPSLFVKVQSDCLAAASFTLDIFYIVRHQDYFAAAGLPSPLTHLWYVSVYIQLVVIWSLALYVIRRFQQDPRRASISCLAVAAASAVWMAMVYSRWGVTRAYYGPDTRLAELAMGSAAAYAMQYLREPSHESRARQRADTKGRPRLDPRRMELAGPPALAGIIIATLLSTGGSVWVYYGGFLLVAVLSAFCCMSFQREGSAIGRALSIRPFRTVSKVSFSCYLVHYPILLLMNPATRTTDPTTTDLILQAAVIVLATIALYLTTERRRPVEGDRSGAHAREDSTRKRRPIARRVLLGSAVAIVALALLPLDWQGIADARARQLRPELAEADDSSSSKATSTDAASDDSSSSGTATASTADEDGPQAEKVPGNLDTSNWEVDEKNRTCSARVLVIGDSVVLGASESLQAMFPNGVIDGKVSRQFNAVEDVYAADTQDYDPDVVVIALGANGLIRDEGIVDSVIDMVGDKPLYFVTIRCPYPLQDTNNDILRRHAKDHDNVGIIDWNGASEGHSEYLVDDGTHLTSAGIEAYTNLYFEALS